MTAFNFTYIVSILKVVFTLKLNVIIIHYFPRNVDIYAYSVLVNGIVCTLFIIRNIFSVLQEVLFPHMTLLCLYVSMKSTVVCSSVCGHDANC
jgi:hypothetical protein